jgi:hypothetical protein
MDLLRQNITEDILGTVLNGLILAAGTTICAIAASSGTDEEAAAVSSSTSAAAGPAGSRGSPVMPSSVQVLALCKHRRSIFPRDYLEGR